MHKTSLFKSWKDAGRMKGWLSVSKAENLLGLLDQNIKKNSKSF